MPYVSITTGEIASGEPVKNSTMTTIKNDLDDHETRIETLEGGTSVFPPIILRANGAYYVMSDVVKVTTNFSLQITGARLLVDQAGSSGTTEIDILVSTGGGPYNSIFSTKPSLSHTAGNDAISTNGVLNPSYVNLVAGDLLRMDITSSQVNPNGLMARIDFTR